MAWLISFPDLSQFEHLFTMIFSKIPSEIHFIEDFIFAFSSSLQDLSFWLKRLTEKFNSLLFIISPLMIIL